MCILTKNKASLMYIMNVNASNNTLSYIHIDLYTIWRIKPPGDYQRPCRLLNKLQIRLMSLNIKEVAHFDFGFIFIDEFGLQNTL